MKKIVKRSILISLALLLVAGIAADRYIAHQNMLEVKATYQEAVELAEQDSYEEAYELLEQINEEHYADMDIDGMISLCQAHMSYDEDDIESAYSGVKSLNLENVSDDILTDLDSFKEQVTADYEVYLEEKAIAESEAAEQRAKEKAEREAAQEKSFLERLSKQVPYVGLSEEYIGKTALGAPSSTVRHNTEMVNGKAYTANLYDFKSGNTTIFTARCVQGEVIQVWDKRDKVSSGSSSSSSSSGSSSKSSSSSSSKSSSSGSSSKDQYNASDYDDPEEFYYDHYDDFDGYEDAEVYWEDAQ
ncbi:MAG: hypothetical protein LUI39_12345 [Lachnospiraceae bacterium]|nr:hypothetical protein [Lachnospiraceae bacterium]